MPKVDDLPHVKRVRAKGRDYYYFDTGVLNQHGKKVYKRLPDIKAPNFGDSYAAFKAGRTRRDSINPLLTVAQLINFYERSPEFSRLSPSTRRVYLISLRKIETYMGKAPVDDVRPSDVARLIGTMGTAVGAANMALAVVGSLYRWGRLKSHVHERTDPVGDHKPAETGSHAPWPLAILTAALAADDQRVKLATHLLYYTAQRISDVCQMRWNDIRGGTISITQAKTDKDLTIPLHRSLAALLEATPKRGMTILTSHTGAPISADRIRKELQTFAAGYGVKLVPHGLRKNAVIALLEAGCSVAETAAVSGQSFQMVEYYAKMRDQQKLSSAAILKWENGK